MISKDTLKTVSRVLAPFADAGAIRADELDEIKTRLCQKDADRKQELEYMTRRELAGMLRVTTKTLDNTIIKPGKIRVFRPTGGRSIRILRTDVEKLMMTGAIESTTAERGVTA